MKKTQLIINLISNIISFALQLGISFILTPIIVEKIGDAAYGFIGLANNFVSYATIVTVAVNSMANRFITLELNKGNLKQANKYYSSVFMMDIILSIIMLIASTIIIANLTTLLSIPEELTIDVKITFSLAFINFIISLIGTAFTAVTFAKNRLDLDAIKNIIANIAKAVVLIVIFNIFLPKVYFISVAAIIYTVIFFVGSIGIAKKIAPELRIKNNNFDFHYVKILIKSGLWNAINSLSRVLLTGLDLLIANIFVSAEKMGILSIAKTIPTSIETLLATVGNIFVPTFIKLYSKNKIRQLVQYVKFSMKVVALILIVPMAGFIIFGEDFFALWLSEKSATEIHEIQILSVLSLLPYVLSCNGYTLFYLDTVTNKLKRPVIFTLVMSIVSTIVTLILVYTTDLGIYAVAGVSSIIWCIKQAIFTPWNAAKNLRIKRTTFFSTYLKLMGIFAFIAIIFIIIRNFMVINNLSSFIYTIGIAGVIGYIIAFLMIPNKEEKKKIKQIMKDKLHITAV